VEPAGYPVTFSVEYPDRDLDRVSTGFRIFAVIPIAIILGLLQERVFGTDDWALACTWR
jgi:hypothetical protein